MSDPQVQLPFAGGLNENIDERHLGPTELVQADNVAFVTDGSAERRMGFEELTPNTGMVSVERLMPMADRLLAVDGEKLWAYNSTSASNGDDFIELGRIAEATVLRTPVSSISSDGAFNGYDVAYGNGMIALAAAVGDNIVVEVYDAATMQLLTSPDLVIPGAIDPAKVRIGWLGTRLVLVWTKVSISGVIYATWAEAADISPTATDGGFQASPVSLVVDGTVIARLPFGVYFNTADAEMYLAYKDTSANDVTIVRVDSTIAVVETVSEPIDPLINDVSVGFDGTGTVMVALSVPAGAVSGLGLITVTMSGWIVMATNVSTGCTVPGDSYRCSVTWVSNNVWYAGLSNCDTDYSHTKFMWRNFSDNCAAIGANALAAWNVVLSGSMFAYNGKAYAIVVHAPPLLSGPYITGPSPSVLAPNGGYYVVELNDDFSSGSNTLRWIATVAPSIVAERFVRDDGSLATLIGQICAVNAVSASQFMTFVATTSATQSNVNVERLDVTFKDTKRWQPAELGGLLYVEGSRYDGRRVMPTGWAWTPTIVSTTSSGVGTIAQGTYGVYAVYERVLADGTIERSAPSNPITITVPVGGYNSVTVIATTCAMYMDNPGHVVLYRTADTSSGNDGVWYRCPDTTLAGSPNTTSDPTVELAFEPVTDAELQDGSHPILYTTGGAKFNTTPPTFRAIVAEDNRLYAIGDDGRTVWYSKQFDGSEAPAFVLDFTFAIEDTRNILTGIGVLDGRKVFFTESDVFVMGGKGPSESGQGNDFNEPDRLPYAFGCINWRSIVTTEDGLWFQSNRGIELLTRGLELAPYQELGAKVRRTLASYPYITSAVVVPEQSQVRFTCSATDDVDDARDGRVLVWDTRFKRWSVHKYRQSQASSTTVAPVTALMHPILGYVWAWDSESDALIKREKTVTDTAPWADYTSAWITRTIKTSWLKTSPSQSGATPTDGLQGKQKLRRVRLLAERMSAHGMSITIGYDYVAGTDVRSFTEATITALGAVEQLRVVPAGGKGRSSAVQVTLEDTAPATIGTGRGCAMNGLAFEVHPKAGPANNIGSSAKG